MPKLMIDGIWRGDVPATSTVSIPDGAFRGWIDPASRPGRYHLLVSFACPFAHRTILARALLQLEHTVPMLVLDPRWNTTDGWVFGPGAPFTHLHHAYAAARPGYTGRVTVPVLWDAQTRTIVNNESRDIVQMLDAASGARLYPEALRPAIDALDGRVSRDLATGVYAVGAATDQAAYDAAQHRVFDCMDALEEILADGRAFLHGPSPTLSDIVAFSPLVRFDTVYNPLFRASWKRLIDYSRLSAWAARVHALPGAAATVRFDHILAHYHDGDWGVRTRTGIAPRLPANHAFPTGVAP